MIPTPEERHWMSGTNSAWSNKMVQGLKEKVIWREIEDIRKVHTATQKQLRGDLIETYKILTGKQRIDSLTFFQLVTDTHSLRGHSKKLFVPVCSTTVQKSTQLLEHIATTCSWRTSDQCIQEQTGQTLDGYGRMKVLAKPINLKNKCEKPRWRIVHGSKRLAL